MGVCLWVWHCVGVGVGVWVWHSVGVWLWMWPGVAVGVYLWVGVRRTVCPKPRYVHQVKRDTEGSVVV